MKNQNTNNQIAENFTFFANITRLTLSDRGWKARLSKWSEYDQNYLDFVREHVEALLSIFGSPEYEFMPEGERVEELQRIFKLMYGLNVYMAWGTWAEGYFDDFARRVREYNSTLYKDSIAHEFGEDVDDPVAEAEVIAAAAALCHHDEDEDDLPF